MEISYVKLGKYYIYMHDIYNITNMYISIINLSDVLDEKENSEFLIFQADYFLI